jgi:hypothetical protein
MDLARPPGRFARPVPLSSKAAGTQARPWNINTPLGKLARKAFPGNGLAGTACRGGRSLERRSWRLSRFPRATALPVRPSHRAPRKRPDRPSASSTDARRHCPDRRPHRRAVTARHELTNRPWAAAHPCGLKKIAGPLPSDFERPLIFLVGQHHLGDTLSNLFRPMGGLEDAWIRQIHDSFAGGRVHDLVRPGTTPALHHSMPVDLPPGFRIHRGNRCRSSRTPC